MSGRCARPYEEMVSDGRDDTVHGGFPSPEKSVSRDFGYNQPFTGAFASQRWPDDEAREAVHRNTVSFRLKILMCEADRRVLGHRRASLCEAQRRACRTRQRAEI